MWTLFFVHNAVTIKIKKKEFEENDHLNNSRVKAQIQIAEFLKTNNSENTTY